MKAPNYICPVCNAQPGQPCRDKHGNRSRYAHSLRGRPAESKMPDLRAWYRSMSRYEGQHAEKRPEGLTV
jgi:hypothetical protein